MMHRTESAPLTLVAIPVSIAIAVCFLAFDVATNITSTWASVGNWAIALGGVFVAITVAPFFQAGRSTRIAAIGFFVSLAASYLALAIAFALTPSDPTFIKVLTGWYIAALGIQAVALWEFVLGLKRAFVEQQRRLDALKGRPEFGRRASDRDVDSG